MGFAEAIQLTPTRLKIAPFTNAAWSLAAVAFKGKPYRILFFPPLHSLQPYLADKNWLHNFQFPAPIPLISVKGLAIIMFSTKN